MQRVLDAAAVDGCLVSRNLYTHTLKKGVLWTGVYPTSRVLDAAATKTTPVHSNLVLKGTLVQSNLVLKAPRMARDLIKKGQRTAKMW